MPVPPFDDNARAWVFTLQRLIRERMINIAGRTAARKNVPPAGTHKQNGRYFTIQPRT